MSHLSVFPKKTRSVFCETNQEPMHFLGHSFVLLEEWAPVLSREKPFTTPKQRPKRSGIESSELPRERLCRDGAEALSLQELIAILLGTGIRGKPVLMLAQELLMHFGSMEGLVKASVQELKKVKGVGTAKALLLKAAFALADRLAKARQPPQPLIRHAEAAYEIAKGEIGHFHKEALLVLLRDKRGRLIHREIVAIGTLSEVLVHPREVFYPAVRHGAHSFILVHNHPSGDPSPSRQDVDLTRVLLQAARVMGIALDDHLIIAKETFVSMRKQGLFGPAALKY
jgi:DNA repair protein RadC